MVMTNSLEAGCASYANRPDPGRWLLRCCSESFSERARTSD